MNPISVIIPSKTVSNFIPCAEAVRRNEPNATIHLMDDGLGQWPPRPDLMPCYGHRCERPFVFARNINLGIKAAGDDGVVLLNDDALLKTPLGFTKLRELSEDHPEFGLIAPVTNVTGAPDQKPRAAGENSGLREVQNIAFVCVYIPRRTINAVGLLDERFVTYGWEDNDYCHRVKLAGLKIGVYDHCFVDHGSLRSTFRGDPHAAGDIEAGRKIFEDKWGLIPA